MKKLVSSMLAVAVFATIAVAQPEGNVVVQQPPRLNDVHTDVIHYKVSNWSSVIGSICAILVTGIVAGVLIDKAGGHFNKAIDKFHNSESRREPGIKFSDEELKKSGQARSNAHWGNEDWD